MISLKEYITENTQGNAITKLKALRQELEWDAKTYKTNSSSNTHGSPDFWKGKLEMCEKVIKSIDNILK